MVLSPTPCWNFELSKVFCMLSWSLWFLKGNCPVVSGKYCFLKKRFGRFNRTWKREKLERKKLETGKANLRILFLKEPMTWEKPLCIPTATTSIKEQLLHVCSKAMLWEWSSNRWRKTKQAWEASGHLRQYCYMRARWGRPIAIGTDRKIFHSWLPNSSLERNTI